MCKQVFYKNNPVTRSASKVEASLYKRLFKKKPVFFDSELEPKGGFSRRRDHVNLMLRYIIFLSRL